MARQLDDQQRQELAAFVNRIGQAAGYTTTAEWARDSGVPAPNLSNIRNGKRGVDGYNLLRLMRAAATRIDGGDELAAVRLTAAAPGDIPAEVHSRLEALAAVGEEILRDQKTILRQLQAGASAPLESGSQAAPRRTRKGR